MENPSPSLLPLFIWQSTTTPPPAFMAEGIRLSLVLLHPGYGIRSGYYDYDESRYYISVAYYRSNDADSEDEVILEEAVNSNLGSEMQADEQSTHWMIVQLPVVIEG
ncbi:hypothetical protein [Spirosoma areae]